MIYRVICEESPEDCEIYTRTKKVVVLKNKVDFEMVKRFLEFLEGYEE